MAGRIRALDWALTPLGPPDAWPQSLRTAVDIMPAMPGPATILWGGTHGQPVDEPRLCLDRVETGAPSPLGPPRREGFGTILTEERIPCELQGRAGPVFPPGGPPLPPGVPAQIGGRHS